jgi:prepilin-type N-terminal cleavage/methylation domain-containing protein
MIQTPSVRPASRAIRGFTLLEILVVIGIIAALMALAIPTLQGVREQGKVTECTSNQRNIAQTLILWKQKNKQRWPKESGIRFLLVLVRDDMIDPKETKVFLCPGTLDDNTSPEAPGVPGSAYAEWDSLDPATISFAGRDTKNYPINPNREGAEVIVSDDNVQGGGNHRSATVYAYADGGVGIFEKLSDEARNRGLDFEKEEAVPIGPDSPVEELRVLQID